MRRVVFDTNVWISGLLWGGKPQDCLILAFTEEIQLYHCDEMLAELKRVLMDSFDFSL